MGKTKWGNGSWQGKHGHANGSASSSYSQWDGWDAQAWEKWSAKPSRGAGNPSANKEGISFPKYQDMATEALTHNEAKEDVKARDEDSLADVPVIQRMVNNIRKAKARVRKARELKMKRDLQWANYQEEVKKMFVSQRMEYRNDVNQMGKEIAEAMQAKQLAVRQLKDGINGGEHSIKTKPGEAASKEDLQSWDELMGAIPPTPAREPVDKWLQEMITATTLNGPAVLSAEQKNRLNSWLDEDGPMTPPSRKPAASPRTPNARMPTCPSRLAGFTEMGERGQPSYCLTMQEPAMQDPYQMSPGTAGLAVQHCAAGAVPPPKSLSPKIGVAGGTPTKAASPVKPKTGLVIPRVPVKQMAKNPPTKHVGRLTSLADLVENKRLAAQKELGIDPTLTPHFILDDGDEMVETRVDLTAME